MTPLTRFLTAVVILSVWLTGGLALATTPQVNDEGKFFSSGAVEKANQKIHDIYRDYGKDLLIETVPGIPDDLQQRYKALGKRKFFVDWAVKRAEESGCKGIYLLLCKNPGYLQIEVGRATRQRGFALEDRDRLFHKMRPFLDKKDQKNNDAALLLAVDTVESTLRTSLGKQPAANETQKHGSTGVTPRAAKPGSIVSTSRAAAHPSESGEGLSVWTWVLIGVGVVVVIWLLMALLRAMSGGGAGAGGYGGPGGGFGGGGGGGFFSSLLAGMFGAAAGAWLYDTFAHGGSSGQAFGATPDQTTMSGTQPSDSDYSGDEGGGGGFGDDNTGDDTGGGGFGDADDSGGGDFGADGGLGDGGDFGGGDFGGGDFGGGGDFS